MAPKVWLSSPRQNSLVQSELRRSGYEELLSAGVVITGGSSVMQGMVELGEELFHMPVRVGYPGYGGTLAEYVRHPRFSTGVGLLLAGFEQHQRKETARMNSGSPVRSSRPSTFGGLNRTW